MFLVLYTSPLLLLVETKMFSEVVALIGTVGLNVETSVEIFEPEEFLVELYCEVEDLSTY